ncbi:MAG: alpha/beta fold hydrolase [Pseudomonadales bacterium]|nr:alpha/beta fold hydrolase [Pseudomonadales bacterium]
MNISAHEIATELSDGCTIRGRLYTSDPSLPPKDLCLCIHGLAVDCNVWNFFAEEWVKSGRSLVCFDLRGHGVSDRGRWYKFRPSVMALDLIQACHQLDLEPSYIVAQSFGNLIALDILNVPPKNWEICHYFAITPVWWAARSGASNNARLLSSTLRFLRSIGKEIHFTSARTVCRRDHTAFAQHPDSHKPRFSEEARSIGWPHYVWLMLYIQWHRWRVPVWANLSNLPVNIIGAKDEGLWDNDQLTQISEKTGWQLHWLEMRHISLSTDPRYANMLMSLIEEEWLLA